MSTIMSTIMPTSLTDTSAPPLQAIDLVKRYPNGVTAVAGVSLTLTPGECLGLLGPNGAGKTTLVEMLEGVIAPTSGQILYRGAPLGARFRQEAGILFQRTALQEFITVGETLRLFAAFYQRPLPLNEVIARCRLADLLDRDTGKLSGGQRQRLLLGLALINDPQLIFLDEPTTGLDPQARRNLWRLIEDIKAHGKTIILTTHYMDEAQRLCDRLAIMDHGRIIATGPPEALLREHFPATMLRLPSADLAPYRQALPVTGKERAGMVEWQTDDVNGSIAALLAAGVSLQHLEIRRPHLEDLFIALTGEQLRA